MSAQSLAQVRWQRRSLAGLAVLVLLAPLFAWASSQTGYAEPMDHAVELVGAASNAVAPEFSLLAGYGIPGLGPHVGTLVAALFGTLLTLGLGIGFARLIAVDN